jgi:hypothetical protein
MRVRPSILAIGGVLAAAACAPKPVHESAWYFVHSDERSAAIAGCQNESPEAADRQNCINASAAAADIERRRFWAIKKPVSRVANPGSL